MHTITNSRKKRLTDLSFTLIVPLMMITLAACSGSKNESSGTTGGNTDSSDVRRGGVSDTTTGTSRDRFDTTGSGSRQGRISDTSSSSRGRFEHPDTSTGAIHDRRQGLDTTGSDIDPYRHRSVDTSSSSVGERRGTGEMGNGNKVDVKLSEYSIDMPRSLQPGMTTFNISNTGTEEHSLQIEGNGIQRELDSKVKPGQSGTLRVNLIPGTYDVTCPVKNHKSEGMTLQVTVRER